MKTSKKLFLKSFVALSIFMIAGMANADGNTQSTTTTTTASPSDAEKAEQKEMEEIIRMLSCPKCNEDAV